MGGNLKRLHKRTGIFQERVAALLELKGLSVSRKMLSQIELGRYSIRVSVLLALKDIYRACVEEFSQGL